MAEEISEILMDSFHKVYENRLAEIVKLDEIPRHIAIIMDGNRRYAASRGDPPFKGHEYGGEKLKELLQWCLDLDVRILTAYAFSTENFSRSPSEVNGLMEMFVDNLRKVADDKRVMEYGVRFRVLGNLDILPENVRDAIHYAMNKTKDNSKYSFNMAVAYGGREEIINAVRNIARDVKADNITIEDIDQALFSSYLYTHELPDPDLILRTSGEIRLSNFLLYQMAYSEFYFTDVYWPGFRKIDFLRAIRAYQMRRRRFGK